MSSALLLFPLGALAYFVYKARESRIFLLGVPMLMFMRESVFFHRIPFFWMPSRLSVNALAFAWLVLVWLLCTDRLLPRRSANGDRRPRPFGPPPLPEELLLVPIAVLIFVNVARVGFRYEDLGAALGEASGMLFMLAGYVFVRGIVASGTHEETFRFLDALVVVSTVAAGLFVLHQGLHLGIYGGEEYYQTVYRGQVITRSFAILTPILVFSLVVLFARQRWTLWTYAAIAVNLVAVWVSYTRSLVVMTAVCAVIILLARLLKGGQSMLAVRRALALAALLFSVGVVVVAYMPTETDYFLSRIQNITRGGVTSATNLQTRSSNFDRAYRIVARDDLALGRGFVSARQDPAYMLIRLWGWDSAWVPVLYRLGVIGLILFAALLAAYAARAFLLLLRSDPDAESVGLVWFPFIVAGLIGSLIGGFFMDPTRYPMDLWFLAVLAAEAARYRLPAQVPAVEDGERGSRAPAITGGV